MNQLKSIVIGAACLLAAVSSTFAQTAPPADPSPARYASMQITSSGAAPKTTYALVSARGAGAPLLKFLSWRSDTTGPSNPVPLVSFICTNVYVITNAQNVAASNVFVSSVLGLFVNDIVVVRSVASDRYFAAHVMGTNGNNLVFTNGTSSSSQTMTLPFAVAAGDLVYRMVTNNIHTLYGTNSLNAPGGLFAGQHNVPFLLQTFGTNINVLDAALVEYK